MTDLRNRRSRGRDGRAGRSAGFRGPRGSGRLSTAFLILSVIIAGLTVLGLVMTFSASFVESVRASGDAFGVFRRQLMWCAVGLVPLVGLALTDYRWIRRLAPLIMLGTLGLATLVLVPGIGLEAQGARRWLGVGSITVQPSEMLKLAVPLFVAAMMARNWKRIRGGDLRALLMPSVPAIAIAALLTLRGPDLETALLIAVIGGVCMFVSGLPGRIVAVGAAAGAVMVVSAILAAPWRMGRLYAWVDPMAHRGDIGYQSVQGLLAMGSGGVFGRGLGQGRGQWSIPAPHTDFIFAVIGEELGLIGALFVVLLFCGLAVGGIRAARSAPDVFGRVLATGITGWLLGQAAMNMASVVGLLPVTGVTLPLVSFGGSSLVVTMTALGLLLSIARAGRTEPAPPTVGARTGGRR